MAEERVKRRLAAILAADVVGYARLMRQDEVGTLARLRTLRRELFEPKISEYGGRVVKTTGDGILIEFPSAVDAVGHAVAVQQAMKPHNAGLPAERRMEIRIGINVGDVIVEDGDLFGDGVNVAARVEGLAEPGGICISASAYEQVRHQLDLKFDDMGARSVKNIAEPVQVYRVGAKDDVAAEPTTDRRPKAPLAMSDRPSIAVLPFENMSGDAEQDYFADGLTEDIITALSVWRSFPVVARQSTFVYKGRAANVQQVASELGAGYVVEGSVRKGGRRVRITAQLIEAGSGNHVWAQKFDRDLDDIFEVQDEITHRIAATIVPELEQAEKKRIAAKHHRNLDAWDFYLRGLSLVHESTRDANIRAREMFEQALQLDPAYGPAISGMAYLLNRDLLLENFDDFEATAARCLTAAKRAVELDEAASISRTELVRALLWSGQHDAAIQEAGKAIELNPCNTVAYGWLGACLAFSGREEEGIPRLHEALELAPRDPRNAFFMTHLALAYLNTGRPEQGLQWARTAAQRQSDFVEAPLALASILAHLDEDAEARRVLAQVGVAGLASAGSRPFWRRYKFPDTKRRFLDGLRKAGLPE